MDDLVLAVTTRDCIALRGFSQRIDLAVLESLQDETWFALPAAIRSDPLAAEVRLVLVTQHVDHVLVDEQGRFAADQQLGPEAFTGGSGLPGLKRRVSSLASAQIGTPCACELAGYAFDPIVLPNRFLLAYRCWPTAHPGQLPAGGGSWVPVSALDGLIQSPVERWFLPMVRR